MQSLEDELQKKQAECDALQDQLNAEKILKDAAVDEAAALKAELEARGSSDAAGGSAGTDQREKEVIVSLQDQIPHLQKTIQDLEAQLKEAHATSAAPTAAPSAAPAPAAHGDTDMDLLKERLGAIERERDALKQQVSELESEAAEARKSAAAAKQSFKVRSLSRGPSRSSRLSPAWSYRPAGRHVV